MKKLRTILGALLLAAAAAWITGCATDTDSTMPWNTPQNWEGPLPSNINEGR
jgi:hypothetical protein